MFCYGFPFILDIIALSSCYSFNLVSFSLAFLKAFPFRHHSARQGVDDDKGLVQSLVESSDDLFQIFPPLLNRQRFLGGTMYPLFVV